MKLLLPALREERGSLLLVEGKREQELRSQQQVKEAKEQSSEEEA